MSPTIHHYQSNLPRSMSTRLLMDPAPCRSTCICTSSATAGCPCIITHPKRRRLPADHSNVLSDMFHRTRASYTIDLSNVMCIIGNLVVLRPGSCHPDIHGSPGRMSQILTMFQVYPVVPIYLVTRDMTTIAIVGFVDPAAGSLGKRVLEESYGVVLGFRQPISTLGRSAPQRFGDHSLVDFATPRYRTLPVDRAQQALGQAAREILLEHSADGTRACAVCGVCTSVSQARRS
jgi:hypothetical protein